VYGEYSVESTYMTQVLPASYPTLPCPTPLRPMSPRLAPHSCRALVLHHPDRPRMQREPAWMLDLPTGRPYPPAFAPPP